MRDNGKTNWDSGLGLHCRREERFSTWGFFQTGTLTEEGLDLMGVIPAENGHLVKIVEDVKQLPPSHPLVVGMATCHSLTLVNGKLTGDPLDLKLFESTDWEINEPRQTGQEGNAVFNSLIPTTVNPRRTAEEGANEAPEEVTDPMLGQIGIVKQFPFSSGYVMRCECPAINPFQSGFLRHVLLIFCRLITVGYKGCLLSRVNSVRIALACLPKVYELLKGKQ